MTISGEWKAGEPQHVVSLGSLAEKCVARPRSGVSCDSLVLEAASDSPRSRMSPVSGFTRIFSPFRSRWHTRPACRSSRTTETS